MNLTPEQLKQMTPEQIAAYVTAMTAAASGPKAAGGRVDDDDIDNAEGEGGSPALTEGTFDITMLSCEKYMSSDQGKGQVPMFRANFTVDRVVTQGPVRPKVANEDERPPPGPVIAGETRKWQCKTTGDKNNQKNLVRIRDLMQALLRFEPGSKLAETAELAQADGKTVPIKWATIMKEAVSEANPFGVNKAKVRITISRIVTKAGFAMYVPTFALHPDVKPRESNIVSSF